MMSTQIASGRAIRRCGNRCAGEPGQGAREGKRRGTRPRAVEQDLAAESAGLFRPKRMRCVWLVHRAAGAEASGCWHVLAGNARCVT
jgi:hypothetical protein